MEIAGIAALIEEGRLWRAAPEISALDQADIDSLAEKLARDPDGRIETISALVESPEPEPRLDPRLKLLYLESLRYVAVRVAYASVGEDWEEIMWAVRPLAAGNSFRVSEALVPLISRIASRYFPRSKSYWAECVLDDKSALAGFVLRGLAASDASVTGILEIFSAVICDIRMDVRHNLGPRAIPVLGRREPQVIYQRLREWAGRHEEIARWNVAKALATPLGAVYVEEAMDILEVLCADERAGVWRAAAAAVVEVAQRRPAFVLPILARWRQTRPRMRAALLALDLLAKR